MGKNAQATERLHGKAEPCFHKIRHLENFHSLSSQTVVHYIFIPAYTTALLAPLDKCQSAEREVAGSNPGRNNTWGLKITEENVLPFL